MHPAEVESRIESAARLFEQERHPDALSALEGIGHLLPNSPQLLLMRVENLSAIGETSEAVHECEKLMRRIDQVRQAGDALDDLLDIDQSSMLADMLTELADRAGTLKNDLDRRQSEAVDTETLQSTVAQLQARLDAFTNQREQAVLEQQQLAEELSRLREQDQLNNEALEKAHTELDAMKHTLLQRESEIEEAESELNAREERVALLETEVAALQKRSASAEESEHLLNEELDRLRTQGDEKTEALNAARLELSHLEDMLEERELAVAEAQENTRQREEAIAQMQGELAGMRDESQKAAQAKESLVAELEQLRTNERNKSEDLEAARRELATLETALQDRESAVSAAESRAKESEQAMALLKNEFDELSRLADEAALNEAELAAELAQLRDNETAKAAALETTRSEKERLARELQEREALLRAESRKTAVTSEAAKALQKELEQLQSKATEFADSEQMLLKELEQLRSSESTKSTVLEKTRAEMDALRGQLDHQEKAVVEAEKSSIEHDAAANALQAELQALRSQAQKASDSENALAEEVALLRENEAVKTEALSAAQAEMEQLRQNLALREQDAEEAEELNAEKQRELDRLQQELASVQGKAAEAQGAESELQRELEQLRKNEEEKNQALELSRLELEALKDTLNDREEAAARAAKEQEDSRSTISKLEDELAALRNRELETATSQDVLQAEVDQIHSEVQKEAGLEQTPQAQQLGQILEQLREMQKAQLEAQRAVQQRAQALAAAQQDSGPMALPPGGIPSLNDSRRQTQGAAFSAAINQPSKRQSQLSALNIAMRQSSRQQSGANASPAAPQSAPANPELKEQQQGIEAAMEQSSQRKSPLDALNAAMQQSSGGAAARAAAPPPQPQPPSRQTAQQALSAAQQLSQRQTQQQSAVSVGRPPSALDADEFESDIVEDYPKPRDVAFVFPDQSISMAVTRRKGHGGVLVLAFGLVLLTVVGVVAYFMQSRPSEAVTDNTPNPPAQTPPDKKTEEEKLKTVKFPEDRVFGNLYDHGAPHTSDTDWPLYAPAKGTVEFPENARFHLEVSKDSVGDLSPLNEVPPDMIQSMRLPSIDMSEKNLAALDHLKGAGVIFIDQEMSDEDLNKVRAALKGRTITCRQPDAVIRDIAPPGERVLTFPDDASLGFLDLRPWHQVEEQWMKFGAAKGRVTIPANMEIKLTIADGVSDLSPLRSLGITDIHTLVVKGPEINDASMEGPAFLRGVLVLEIDSTAITDAGMKKLSRNVGLQQLKLTNTRVGDAGIEVLKKIPLLERVYIDGAPNITALSLPVFRELRALRRLHLANSAVSANELGQLARDMPSCAITPGG